MPELRLEYPQSSQAIQSPRIDVVGTSTTSPVMERRPLAMTRSLNSDLRVPMQNVPISQNLRVPSMMQMIRPQQVSLLNQNPVVTEISPSNPNRLFSLSYPIGPSQPILFHQPMMNIPQKFERRPAEDQIPTPTREEAEDNDTGDERNNRRREMNRQAQQKSRQRKEQLRQTLQSENDSLKAEIISLKAEVNVWKNMTKKVEKEAAELKKKVQQYEDAKMDVTVAASPVQEKKIDFSKKEEIQKAEMSDDDMRLQIVSTPNSEALSYSHSVASTSAGPSTSKQAEEEKASTSVDQEEMKKEIELLTQELQRMYNMMATNADRTKQLHQALSDQQKRQVLYNKRKEREAAMLEFSGTHTTSIDNVKKQEPSRLKVRRRRPYVGSRNMLSSKRDKTNLLRNLMTMAVKHQL